MKTVAGVFFEGFAPLDAYGPIQAFALSFEPDAEDPSSPNMDAPLYKVISVGQKTGLVAGGAAGSPATQIDYTFETCPPVDIVLIPGGGGTRPLVKDRDFIAAMLSLCERTPMVATVCTGAAKSGYLGTESWPRPTRQPGHGWSRKGPTSNTQLHAALD